ncbi:type II toxin-antitoxin system Phd/YefM family antitoxin [Andreprevotia chitinilytica]|uniref:type II toxin-antitoxin system Phd/YefM family antitoxin n=1 Tax=Andreprevotia chitinilytica TaxID=396808 RepID=UPI00055936DD|nr:type II toxin-antitoxin system prevent-host-death family antitoxin [Andreprevotia chitinilytica]
MLQINVTQLRQHLPLYLGKVQAGEEVQITIHGKVVARLMPEVDHSEAALERLAVLRTKAVVGDLLAPIDAGWGSTDDHL